jgi:drug/metabolite transporter (DMT)-like permease
LSSKADPTSQPVRIMWYQTPVFVLTIGIIAVSSASLFIRYAQQEMPSLVVAALRLGFASILMTPWILKKHTLEIKQIKPAEWIRIVGAGLLLAIHFSAWITSLEYTSVTSSVVLVTTTPIWVALFSSIFLKEIPGRMIIIGLVVAIFGGVVVSLANECSFSSGNLVCSLSASLSKPTAMLGNTLALIGAVCAAIYLIIGRVLRKTVNLTVYVYCIFSCAALFLVLFVILAGQSFSSYPLAAYGFCLALAVFPQIVGHTSLNWALAYLPVGLVAIVLLGEPVGSSILAAIFLKEIPNGFEILGGVTILLGIYLASRNQA